MKKFKRQNEAITLVSLVITIIILLILAGITIATLTGENGLITRVKQAKKAQIEAEIKESLILAVQDLQVQKVGDATLDDITQEWIDKKLSEYNSSVKDDASISGKKITMKKDGITNIWIQSAYRSVARQKELYDASVKKYLQEGKTQEEAEKLTNEYINKPGSSDHNLGLAVDFNKVDNEFEKLEGFKWLQKNAENYGFVLRYPKDKEDITKIAYESWHWRYVGVEHAKKMNELNMCLEEYIKYLKTH